MQLNRCMADLLVNPGLEARLKQKINFLSSITGLPIVKTELVMPAYDSSTGTLPDFTFDLQLEPLPGCQLIWTTCRNSGMQGMSSLAGSWKWPSHGNMIAYIDASIFNRKTYIFRSFWIPLWKRIMQPESCS